MSSILFLLILLGLLCKIKESNKIRLIKREVLYYMMRREEVSFGELANFFANHERDIDLRIGYDKWSYLNTALIELFKSGLIIKVYDDSSESYKLKLKA